MALENEKSYRHHKLQLRACAPRTPQEANRTRRRLPLIAESPAPQKEREKSVSGCDGSFARTENTNGAPSVLPVSFCFAGREARRAARFSIARPYGRCYRTLRSQPGILLLERCHVGLELRQLGGVKADDACGDVGIVHDTSVQVVEPLGDEAVCLRLGALGGVVESAKASAGEATNGRYEPCHVTFVHLSLLHHIIGRLHVTQR
jgi:hypothetical protein